MTSLWTRRSRYSAAGIALLSATLLPGLVQLPADAGSAPAVSAAAADKPNLVDTLTTIGDPVRALATIDTRGKALPSLLQKQAAARLGDVDLRWNRFGTPASILPADGVLAKATSNDPVKAARKWLRVNHDLFGITQAQVTGMEAIDQPLVYSKNHAVFFRQRFGGLLPAIGSAVTVAVGDGKIAYVSSSITKTTQQIPTATITPAAGWLKAAESVGLDLPVDLGSIVRSVSGGWTRLSVPGIVQQQLVRVRALANADGSVRPVLEANVVDVQGGTSTAYTVLVDGVSGAILHRENKVLNYSNAAGSASTVALQSGVQSGVGAPPMSNGSFPFMGTIVAPACGPKHPFAITDGATKTIAAVAAAVNVANDITINLYGPDDTVIASQDLLTSPEALTYTADSIPAGTYSVEVCPFDSTFIAPGNYTVTVITSDQGASTGGSSGRNPKWRFFPANPTLDSPTQTPKNAVVGCWLTAPGCTLKTGRFNNVAAISPWDTLPSAPTVSTMTTKGNNALTTEAWASPLTPGGLLQAPVSLTGSYTTPFTDAWNNSQCDPLELVPGGNDINFSVGNLFVTHNRMHDYSYYLGFTEKAYNMQVDNTGRGGTGADPEIGNVQAGAIGGQVSGLGRDNANQIALQDGVPGITNQYLFQPIAGAFYSPCTDGGLDMGIVGHEYTHAISNRMVGGPDEGLTSEQGGAMGESWSDQVAAEFQFSHGYSNGGNVWAVGAYATGNKTVAIRDYAINHNPLNYSNYGFDSTGPEVHADGEIWNGTQWEVRQALVKKYNKRYPYNDKKMQLLCAQAGPIKGVQLPYTCPGNRRWIQLIFDSFLFQQGATSMLDARDGMIAADQLRFGGANKSTLWDAFARRGMGVGAKVVDGEDVAPKPSFKSIGAKKRNTLVLFKGTKGDAYYVGDYQQRSRPIGKFGTKRNTARAYFTPGTYDMLFVGKKTGHQRFHLVIKKGQKVKVVKIKGSKNYAAAASGAKVVGTTGGESRNPSYAIDGTEVNGWGVVSTDNVDATKPTITIDLAGSKPVTIRSLAVSASLRPAWPGDDTAGSRFTALRQFAVEACVKSCTSASAKWTRFYTSAGDAFPSVRPRPVAPNLNMRAFQTKPTKATALRFVVLENQCSGFAGYAGELDTDPLNETDCKTGSDRGTIAHVTEIQAFSTVPKASDWKSSYGIDNASRFFPLKK